MPEPMTPTGDREARPGLVQVFGKRTRRPVTNASDSRSGGSHVIAEHQLRGMGVEIVLAF